MINYDSYARKKKVPEHAMKDSHIKQIHKHYFHLLQNL